MRKFFKYAVLTVMATFAITACTDKQEPWSEGDHTLVVKSRETSFQAPASTGKIVLETADPVKVEVLKVSEKEGATPASWVTTTVDKNVVNVNVTANASIDGRTAMLEITAGDKKTQIAVYQAGCVFQVRGERAINANDAAATYTYEIYTNLKDEIKIEASDFITTTLEGNTLTADVAANATGKARYGTINISCGELGKDQITVLQFDFSKDLVNGTFAVAAAPTIDGDVEICNIAKLTKTGSAYTIDVEFEDGVRSLPVTLNTANRTFTLKSGDKLGTATYNNKNYYLTTCLISSANAYAYTAYNFTSSTSTYDRDEETGMSMMIFGDFANDGAWSGNTAVGYSISYFSGATPTAAGRLKTAAYATWFNPMLVCIYDLPANNAAMKSAAKKMLNRK